MRKNKISRLDFKLEFSLIKEGSVYVAYTPALDISTYGKTKFEAKKNFSELVDCFFEEFTDRKDALEVVLESLGWHKQKSIWQPPTVTHETVNISVAVAA